jgi:hypothetical protein
MLQLVIENSNSRAGSTTNYILIILCQGEDIFYTEIDPLNHRFCW